MWEKRYGLILLGVVCALAVLACLLLYQFDNKYTTSGPAGFGGVLDLGATDLAQHPVIFLVEGWEYYGGQLLSPEDFTHGDPAPDAYIFIGQYGGFDTGDMSALPHGSASYRLRILVPEEPGTFLLELPEVFSAYRAYINGILVQAMGEPDPMEYIPETGNRTIKIDAGGEIEILIAVSDFSHIYSGLTYPPAFGVPEAVNRLLSARLIFRNILIAFALSIGLIALLIGFASDKKLLAALFAALCLFYIGYICYPVLRTLVSTFYPFYTIEMFSFNALLATVILIQHSVYGSFAWSGIKTQDGGSLIWHGIKYSPHRFFFGFGVIMCLLSIILPFALTNGNLFVMATYSYLVMAYQWVTAVYLTVTAVRATLRDTRSRTLLYGIVIFDIALLMDRLLPFHEPKVTGWFPELAGFALTLCIGIVIAQEVAAKYRSSAIMEERMSGMERLSEMQRTNYELLRERIEETKMLRHDLRHHFVMVDGFVQTRDYENLEVYVQKFHESIHGVLPVGYSDNPVVNVLMRHYSILAEKENTRLTLKLEVGQDLKVSEADLCAVLSNLLENALEACKRQTSRERYIILSMGQKTSMLSIRMENSTDGNLTIVSNGEFISSKGENRKGYGLDSVRSIAERYLGEVEFHYDEANQVFVSTVLLMLI